MYQSIKNSVVVLFSVAVLTSCNFEESLQGYYVANQETPNFISVDIPVSFVKIDEEILSEEQLEAYESIDKLNMLGYTKTDNEEEYQAELAKVQELLKNEKYEELMRGGNSKDGKFIVKMIGDEDAIDELIVFGSANDKGFAIVRVLGNNMDPAKIMKLGDVLSKMQTEETAVQDFMDFFQ